MLMKSLAQFGSVPFTRGSLTSVLRDYRRPNDKIAQLIELGYLLPLKKGVYVLGDKIRTGAVSMPLVANILYGPSVVSSDSALAWHGLIPEGVFGVTSVTPRRARSYSTPLGEFSYQHIPASVYPVGIRIESGEGNHRFLMASPVKALCDKILLTRRVRLTSFSAMRQFLEEDLRLDMDELQGLDLSTVRMYQKGGLKVAALTQLQRVLEALE